LAPDGGLYLPEQTPQFALWELERLAELATPGSYPIIAHRLLERWCPDVHPSLLRSFVEKAYTHPSRFENSDIAALNHLEGNQYVLELFHGPTAR
jgi:threonine synthase